MIRQAIILALLGGASAAYAETSNPKLDCLRAGVTLSNVAFAEVGESIPLPKIIGQISNGMPWAITGFRFDYGVEDTATGTVWQYEYVATDVLDPPLMPGESRDFVTYSNHYDADDNSTIKLTPTLWDVLDADGLEFIDDDRQVGMEIPNRVYSRRNC